MAGHGRRIERTRATRSLEGVSRPASLHKVAIEVDRFAGRVPHDARCASTGKTIGFAPQAWR